MSVARSQTTPDQTRQAVAAIPELRLPSAPTAAFRPTARDLFTFRGAEGTAPAAPVRQVSDPPPAAIATLPDLALKLVGIAADGTGDNVVRTAIVTSSDELFLAKEGEFLTPRYLVLSISENALDARDMIGGAKRRLTLR